MPFRFILTATIIFICYNTWGQELLKGRIFPGKTDSALASTIFNTTRNSLVRSGKNNSYSIAASEGDKIIFSSVGYRPDTISVVSYMFLSGYDVTLQPDNNALPFVSVFSTNKFRADSLSRRNDYKLIYDQPITMVQRSGPPKGFGIILSPVTYFSREGRQKRILKQRLKREEEESFVDYCFSKPYVEKITGLHGDSLQLFMVIYRPSYAFCIKMGREGMAPYLNEKRKLFIKRKED